MSTLTKIFVLLLVLFSIAFSSMTVAMVARTQNWKDTAEKYREHARIADTNLRHAHAAAAARLAAAQDEIQSCTRDVSALQSELESVRADVGRLESELAKVQSEKSSVEAINRGLLAQLDVANKTREEYRTQRNQLEQKTVDLERRNIDLNDRVNELTAQVTVLMEQQRQFEQQLNMLREENERLSQAGGRPAAGATFESPEGIALEGVEALTPVPPRAIRGHVMQVDGDLITISVGSTDGVKKGMVFVVHRAGEYVGDVEINAVDPDRAGGRIIRSTGQISVEDRVTDAVWLARSRE